MASQALSPNFPTSDALATRDDVERRIWLVAYLHALETVEPKAAEIAADDAVNRYGDRWVGGARLRVPEGLRPYVMPRPEYEGLVVI